MMTKKQSKKFINCFIKMSKKQNIDPNDTAALMEQQEIKVIEEM